jgi:hypothetical protein
MNRIHVNKDIVKIHAILGNLENAIKREQKHTKYVGDWKWFAIGSGVSFKGMGPVTEAQVKRAEAVEASDWRVSSYACRVRHLCKTHAPSKF